MTTLCIHNLTAAQPGLFDNISLYLEGGITAVVGESGCGKTTLLRSIAGLQAVKSGCIKVNNKNVSQRLVAKRNIGLVFQNYALFPHMTAAQNVLFGIKKQRLLAKKPVSKALAALQLVQLAQKADAYPSQLSGGQQQRVALARALAAQPSVMLLDEPFSGLDCKTRRQVCDGTMLLLRRQNIPTLFVTHDIDEAYRVADQVLELKNGCLVPHRSVQQAPVHHNQAFQNENNVIYINQPNVKAAI